MIRHLASSVALALVACACLRLGGQPVAQQAWALDARRAPLPAADGERSASAPVLLVRPFRAVGELEARGFLVRAPDGRVERDFYHEHALPPAERVGQLALRWLADSGLFRAVLAPGTLAEPDLALDGRLAALHVAREADGGSSAVVELESVLVDARSGALLHLGRYLEREELAGEDPALVVAGWDRALERVLARLEHDLGQALARADGAGPGAPAR